jgi:hypothetical protein
VSGAAGDIKPDLQLTPEDVAAYGVSTITDLIDQLNRRSAAIAAGAAKARRS